MTKGSGYASIEPAQGSISSRPPQTRLIPLIVLVALILASLVWGAVRNVETLEARVHHDRALLEQGSALRVEVGEYSEAMNALTGVISAGELPSAAQLGEIFQLGESGREALYYVEIVRSTADWERIVTRESRQGTELSVSSEFESVFPRFVLVRTVVAGVSGPTQPGVESQEPMFGLDGSVAVAGDGQASAADHLSGEVLTDPDVVRLVFDIQQRGDAAVLAENRAALLLGANELAASSLGVAAPVIDNEGSLRGILVGQLDLRQSSAMVMTTEQDADLAFVLSVGGREVLVRDGGGQRAVSGDPIIFVGSGENWVLQGLAGGSLASRSKSRAVLVVGFGLAAAIGLLLQHLQGHAQTLGRLERSEYDAIHDPLTGLLNRAGITESLTNRIEDRKAGEVVGVLFLDLDRLKVINDSIGHSAGDEVLVVVAARLTSILRDGDVVGRFGGDEFVVVCAEAKTVGDVTRLADRVLQSLKESATLSDDSTQTLSASIGISYVVQDPATAEDLLRDADLAMYRAKGAGGARYEVFDAKLRAEALERLEVERELRRAIRTGQLVVHYQPIVDLSTGRVNRVEALVRWQHPVKGMIPPGAFLSVAAESGLIVDVGEHVLRESCRQAALWSTALGRKVMVSVNVAERQLLDGSLVDMVGRVLDETGIEPSQLELELTEELIVERLDARLSVLYELVDMGVKLAIDDFGTSRASLGQLKRLDMVSTLKIDRAFVIDVAVDDVDRKIITAIVALADSVGMEVVAEGVEDREQVEVLRDLGIGLIQGFYFQRPAPSEQTASILAKTFDVPVSSALEVGLV